MSRGLGKIESLILAELRRGVPLSVGRLAIVVLAAHRNDFNDFFPLLEIARQKDVGTIGIKAITKQPWEEVMRMYRTWYEPFDEQEEIDKSLWYALSQGITTTAMPGDLHLWPLVIDAAERFRVLDTCEQEEAISEVKQYKPIFPNILL